MTSLVMCISNNNNNLIPDTRYKFVPPSSLPASSVPSCQRLQVQPELVSLPLFLIGVKDAQGLGNTHKRRRMHSVTCCCFTVAEERG